MHNKSIFLIKMVLLCFNLINCGCLFLNKQPHISIITSIFQGDQFIEHFLADITKQTVFKNCELILIDANLAPSNYAKSIINKYLERYPNNIFYHELGADPGLYAVWNLGIHLARGQYLTNANLDDRLAFNCYEQHAQVLDLNPTIDLVYSDYYCTKKPNETFLVNSSIYLMTQPQFVAALLVKQNLPGFNPMWRKSLHARYGYFDEKFKIAGDWEFWIRVVAQGASFLKVSGVYGLFYLNPTGLSRNLELLDIQKAERKLIRKKHANFFKKHLKSIKDVN